MRLTNILLAAVALQASAAAGADILQVQTGGAAVKPVPIDVASVPKDSPEAIAKDAARDLKDSHFYNKPGATRAQYDADWQQRRLFARGSTTPTGSIPYYYNPAVASPLAAGIGGGIAAAIGAAIVEGIQRRANRRNCLLIRGWRQVEVPEAEVAKIAAMSDVDRSAYLNQIVGAATVTGKITERTSFLAKTDPSLNFDTPVSATPTLFLGKKVDTTAPLVLGPGEAAVVVSYRRPIAESADRSAALGLWRYDLAARDLIYQPKNWKKVGDKTSYAVDFSAGDRHAPLEVQIRRVTPGDYVLQQGSVAMPMTSYCFGAPTLSIAAGEVLYLGDYIPFAGKSAEGERLFGIAYRSHIEDSRAALRLSQPLLAAALKPATLRNRATFACSGAVMDRWDLPGLEELPALQVATAGEGQPAAH